MNIKNENVNHNSNKTKIKSVLILISIVAFLVIISLVANNWFNKQTILNITIQGNCMLTNAEINSIIDDKIMNVQQQGIDIIDIKKTLLNNEFIESADVFIKSKKFLGINVIEKVPFAVFIDNAGTTFFIDKNKNIFAYKLFNKYNDLPIISNCNAEKQKNDAIKILSVLKEQFPILYSKISEISYNKKGYNLLLNIADISINIGDIIDLDTKLSTIDAFLNNTIKLPNDISGFNELDARWKNKIVVRS